MCMWKLEVLDILELELLVVVNHPVWVLETEHRSSTMAHCLNH